MLRFLPVVLRRIGSNYPISEGMAERGRNASAKATERRKRRGRR